MSIDALYTDDVSTQGRARILVVDDDPAVTSLLRRGFTYEGYEVHAAGSGAEALQLARDHAPRLVILDIMMPGMDGLDVCRRLREADGTLPILLLTAKDAPGDQIKGLDIGADDYVTKPFSFEVLAARTENEGARAPGPPAPRRRRVLSRNRPPQYPGP